MAKGVSAGMIEVQMAVDDHLDVARRDPELRESIFETRRSLLATILDAIDVVELRVFLVARAGIDQHRPDVVLDQQTPHAKLNPVARVGGNAALPERLGHDAEHRAAVELLATGLNRMHAKTAELSCCN